MSMGKTKEENRELPNGWQWAMLGDACRQDRQIVEPFSDDAGALTYYSLEHIEAESGRILKQPQEQVEDEGKSTTFRFDNRHVLYGKLRPYLNKVALPDTHGRCTTEMIPLLPSDNVDREFLAWLLRRSDTVERAMQNKTGSRMPRADMDDLLTMPIPLPPLAEQQRIAGLLKGQMAAVEAARAAARDRVKVIRELKESILNEVFAPERVGLWKIRTIRDIASLVIDGPHVTPLYVPIGIPFVTVRNIQSGRLDFRNLSYITEEDHQQFCRRGRAEIGDILYTKDGTLGIPCVVDTDQEFSFFVSVALIKLRREVVVPNFVAFAMKSRFVLGQVKRLGAGAGLKHMVLKSINALEIPCPALDEQRRIAEMLSEQMTMVEKALVAAEGEQETINALPAALLRRAFNGEL